MADKKRETWSDEELLARLEELAHRERMIADDVEEILREVERVTSEQPSSQRVEASAPQK